MRRSFFPLFQEMSEPLLAEIFCLKLLRPKHLDNKLISTNTKLQSWIFFVRHIYYLSVKLHSFLLSEENRNLCSLPAGPAVLYSVSFILGMVLWACPSLYFSRRNCNHALYFVICFFMHMNIASCFLKICILKMKHSVLLRNVKQNMA